MSGVTFALHGGRIVPSIRTPAQRAYDESLKKAREFLDSIEPEKLNWENEEERENVIQICALVSWGSAAPQNLSKCDKNLAVRSYYGETRRALMILGKHLDRMYYPKCEGMDAWDTEQRRKIDRLCAETAKSNMPKTPQGARLTGTSHNTGFYLNPDEVEAIENGRKGEAANSISKRTGRTRQSSDAIVAEYLKEKMEHELDF